MKPIASASMLKIALLGGVAIGSLLSGAFQASAEVGVTAAVNVDARGRPPGAAPRVLALGANIVHNEQVTTDGQGLVQILLLDGTTFTVGPNSNLTIDEFVYNPETGDAKVVASLTKGVFRFVGARTSQTEGGATVKTPVGTIGIRGGVANFSYDPATGESKAALVAGKNLTITDGDGTQRIVYETGYTAVITRTEGGGTSTLIRKSTKEETGLIQQQLAGKPGQNGGTGNPPTDETVENSEVGETNSGLPDNMTFPGSPKPVQSSGPQLVEETIDNATQDDLNSEIADQPTYSGFFSGMGQSSIAGENPYALSGQACGDGCSPGETNFSVRIDNSGNPVSAGGELTDSQYQNPVVKKILVSFGGKAELHTDYGVNEAEELSSYIVSGRTNPIPGFQHLEGCEDCDFIHWGWWGTRVQTDVNPNANEEDIRTDYVHRGTWVAGKISDPDEVYNGSTLPFGGSATYTGTALGTVARETSQGVAQYVARGDLVMDYHFSDREGTLRIQNFDGMSVSGTVTDDFDNPTGKFGGSIGFSDTLFGSASGAFVDNPNGAPNVAAGVIGNFNFSGQNLAGDNVSAVGTFAGKGAGFVGTIN